MELKDTPHSPITSHEQLLSGAVLFCWAARRGGLITRCLHLVYDCIILCSLLEKGWPHSHTQKGELVPETFDGCLHPKGVSLTHLRLKVVHAGTWPPKQQDPHVYCRSASSPARKNPPASFWYGRWSGRRPESWILQT